jgi:cytochrome b561
VARALHWSIALGLAGLFALGWYMTELSYYDPWYKQAFDWHKGVGILLLILALGRLVWTVLDRRPDLPEGMKPWERAAAKGTHHVLYAMTILIPVSGYFISTADGHAVDVFGWFEVPAILPSTEGGEEIAGRIHYFLAFGTAYLVGLHTLAALKHQFLNRDGTLTRMIGSPPQD